MDGTHLERLTAADCRRLLPGAPIGRLAVPTPNFPTLDPVSFALVEGELVVAVRAGSAGEAIAAGTVVAFEADVLDREMHRGWSVVVKGPVEDLDDDVAEIVRPLLGPWPVAPSDRLLLVRSDRITGQRVVTGSDPEPEVAPDGPVDRSPAGLPAVVRRSLVAHEALGLLRSGGEPVGRLVVTVSGEPSVFPLNFAVDGDAVVFRTQPGTKLTGITRSLATFQVDRIDASGQGWSICVEGLAQEMLDADPAALWARIQALELEAWPGGDRPHVVRITPFAVRGMRWSAVAVTTGPAEPAGGRTGVA